MNSIFAQLYLDIQEQIKQEVTEIDWIEQDFGQDTFDKWRPNVSFPALLIDFADTEYEMLQGYSQFANVTIRMRLLVTPFSQSYEDAPIEVRTEALEFFNLEQKLIKALHGWRPDGNYTQELIRTRASANNRNDLGLRIRELTFTTAFEEMF